MKLGILIKEYKFRIENGIIYRLKILLIYPPINTNLPTKGSFPLGLGYIASVLLKFGHEVDVLDININSYSRNKVHGYLKQKCNEFDIIGISGMITTYGYIKWLADILKTYAPAIPLIVGGTVASPIPEFVLRKTKIDIVCVGEGEVTFKELADALEKKNDISSVCGIYYKQSEEILKTPKRELIRNLDDIPFPQWGLFRMKKYIRNNYLVNCPVNSINIIAGRGCPYLCTFCYRNFGRTSRFRSIENVISEIEILMKEYKIKHFDFQDELFTQNNNYVKAFCENLLKRNLRITWRCLGRVNMADYNLFKLMKEAGCHWLGFGIESGSPRMLNEMSKNINLDQAKRAITLGRKAGLHITGTFIIGMPGETKETVQETIDFCKNVGIYNKPFYPVPYPGTKIYKDLKSKGTINRTNEEALILKMDRDATNLIINLTGLSDNALRRLKENAEKQIERHIKSNKNLKYLISYLLNDYKMWGLFGLIRKYLKMSLRKIEKTLSK